jgi:hypothetical protein
MNSFHQFAGLTARAHEWAGFAAGMQLKLWRQAAEAAMQAPYEQMRLAHSMVEAQRRLMGVSSLEASAAEAEAKPAAKAAPQEPAKRKAAPKPAER